MMQFPLCRSRRWQAFLVAGTFLGGVVADAAAEESSRGKQLAEQQCTRCHQLPDPHDLPKNVETHRAALANITSMAGRCRLTHGPLLSRATPVAASRWKSGGAT